MLKDLWARLLDAVDGGLYILASGLLALAATVTIVVSVDGGSDGLHPHITVTVKTASGAPKTITTPAPIVKQAAIGLDDHQGARDETPAGVPAPVLEAGREQQEALAATDQLPIVSPAAAPVQAGCTSKFVRNYSTRRGVRPRLWVLHYTVSPNRPGWDDVNAIVSLFDQPAFAASSNYVVDAEGHCAYIVRESDKAWTQAAANPVAISVEVINTGSEATYVAAAGLAKLARVISDSTARWDIPLQTGAVSGCTVTRPGIVDHHTLGACGGGHFDITPFQTGAVIAAAIAYRRAHDARAVGARAQHVVDRRTCRRLNRWRRAGRPGGDQVAVNVRRRQALAKRGLVCTAAGPVRS